MPARFRSSPLAGGLSATDLPILPFLAPRLFQPWPIPIRSRRAKSTGLARASSGNDALGDAGGERAPHTSSASVGRREGDISGAPFGDRCRRITPQHGRDCSKPIRVIDSSNVEEHMYRKGDESHHWRPIQSLRPHEKQRLQRRSYNVKNEPSEPPPEPLGLPMAELSPDKQHRDELSEQTPIAFRDIRWAQEDGKVPNSNPDELGLQTSNNRSVKPSQNLDARVLDENGTYSPSIRRVNNPHFRGFPHLDKSYFFMQKQRIGRKFGDVWEFHFTRYHELLDRHRNTWPDRYAQLMQESRGLLNHNKTYPISKIRRMWLEMLLSDDRALAEWEKNGDTNTPKPNQVALKSWPHLMLSILADRPEDGLKFLVATCISKSLQHRRMYADVIDYVVNYFIQLQEESPFLYKKLFHSLFNCIMSILRYFSDTEVSISDYACIELFRHCDIVQAEELYTVLLQREKVFKMITRISLASILGRKGATDVAVDLLSSLRGKTDFKSPLLESVCATVLRGSQKDPNQVMNESEVFQNLLLFGITPRVNFYNILAHNAVESDDHETALRVYDTILENGIEPSPHTYSILLNGAKWRRDHECCDQLVATVQEKDVRNEYVANDMLHAIWLFYEDQLDKTTEQHPDGKEATERMWRQLMSTYAHYFEMGPLLDLSPKFFRFTGRRLPRDVSAGRRMHPDSTTLQLMIAIALKCRVKTRDVLPLYQRYKSLLEGGHPDYIRIAKQGTAMSDTFIARFGMSPATLPHCMAVMVDLLTAQERVPKDEVLALHTANKSLDSAHQLASYPPKSRLPFAKPTVNTWTVLMQSFMRQEQARAAEKVLSMMVARDVAPDYVTWNALIRGYVGMLSREGVEDSMVRAERAGFATTQELRERVVGTFGQVGIVERVVRMVAREEGREVEWLREVEGERRELEELQRGKMQEDVEVEEMMQGERMEGGKLHEKEEWYTELTDEGEWQGENTDVEELSEKRTQDADGEGDLTAPAGKEELAKPQENANQDQEGWLHHLWRKKWYKP